MPIKDLRSNLNVVKILNAIQSTLSTAVTAIYDSGNDEAVVFFLSSIDTDGGATLTISNIEEDDDSGFSSPNSVASNKIIGNFANTDITTANQDLKVGRIGVFSTKRFLRVTISNATPGAGSTYSVIGVSSPNLLPAIEPED